MSTQDFQQDFDQIMQSAHAVVARMYAVDARMRKVHDTVQAVNESVKRNHSDVEGAAARVHGAAVKAGHMVHDAGDALVKDHIHPLADHLHAAGSHLEALRGTLDDTSKELLAAIDRSREQLHAHCDGVTQLDHNLADGVSQTVEHVKGEAAHLAEQFEGHTQPAMHGIGQFLAQVREHGEALTHEAHGTLDHLREDAESHLHSEFLEPVQQHLAQHADLLQEIAHGDVDTMLKNLADQGREHLENGVKHVISDLADQVASGLDHVHEAIHKSGEQHGSVRELLKPVFDEVEKAIDPVKNTIDNVKSVASAVGFDL